MNRFTKATITIVTDASLLAWGGILEGTTQITNERGLDPNREEAAHQPVREVGDNLFSTCVLSCLSKEVITIMSSGTGLQDNPRTDRQHYSCESYQSDGRNTLVCTDGDYQEHMDMGIEQQVNVDSRVCTQRGQLSGCALKDSRQLQLVPTTVEPPRSGQSRPNSVRISEFHLVSHAKPVKRTKFPLSEIRTLGRHVYEYHASFYR